MVNPTPEPKSPPELTSLELTIMKVIWGGEITTRAIWTALQNGGMNVAFSTVSTYLQRMIQKGHLEREPVGEGEREYNYKAKTTKEQYRELLMNKARALYDTESELLQHFTGSESMDPQMRKGLQQIIAKLKRHGK